MRLITSLNILAKGLAFSAWIRTQFLPMCRLPMLPIQALKKFHIE